MTEPTAADVLATREHVHDLAALYETVAALEPVHPEPMRAVPGPRMPPGLGEILDADEVARAIRAVDEDAESWAHMVLDSSGGTVPDSTPARLRWVGDRVGAILDDDDELFALSFLDDLRDRRREMRRLSRRTVRTIRTGMRCQAGCGGQYVSPLGSGRDHEGAINCGRCGHMVEFAVWSRWPRARVRYITAEHAAKILGAASVRAVHVRASRQKWRRVGTGSDVRYDIRDVRGESDDTPEAVGT